MPKAPKRIGRFERRFGPLSPAERYRINALAAGLEKYWDAFEDNWLGYAIELEKSSDPDAALTRSVIFRHLADTALEVPDINDPEFEDDPIANWLMLSVEACPDDSECVLKLIARLREGGHAKEAGTWADWAVERFPEDAAVLMEAIEAAAGRSAFAKAADLAARLLKVDPINTLARQRLSDMKIAHARKKMRQGRADLAARELDEAARAERRDGPDGALKLARGFVAIRAGKTEDGWSQVHDGVLMLGNGVPAWLRAVVEGRAMGLTEKELQPAVKELTTAMSAAPTGGGDLYPYCFQPIITKNTPIPVRRSEVFYTVMPDQPEVEITVFQGENRDAQENIQIGEFRVVGLSRSPPGNEIVVDLALDRDGILQVTAREKKTGLQQRIVIDQAIARLGEAGMAEARERIGSLFGPAVGNGAAAGSGAGGEVPPNVAELRARAEAKLDGAGEEDRAELIDLIEAIRDARMAGDTARLTLSCEQLSDLIFYLET